MNSNVTYLAESNQEMPESLAAAAAATSRDVSKVKTPFCSKSLESYFFLFSTKKKKSSRAGVQFTSLTFSPNDINNDDEEVDVNDDDGDDDNLDQ